MSIFLDFFYGDQNNFKYLCPKVQANQHVIYCFHLCIQRAPSQLFFSNSVTNLEQEYIAKDLCETILGSSAFNILYWCICCVLLQQRSISIRRIFQKKPRDVYTAQLEKVILFSIFFLCSFANSRVLNAHVFFYM